MTSDEAYCGYLLTRSRTAQLYRRYLLYPIISRYLRGRTLDVGCGIGDMLRFRPNTIGADVNPHAVAYCRNQGLDARLMEDGSLPFADGDFDCAVLDNVLEHIDQPREILREIKRVMRPGGTLVVGVPGERGYRSDPDHRVYYDEPLLVATMQQEGFAQQRLLHMPMRSRALSRRVRQYCIYGVFVKA